MYPVMVYILYVYVEGLESAYYYTFFEFMKASGDSVDTSFEYAEMCYLLSWITVVFNAVWESVER